MGTIATILIVLYLIVVLIIMLEKKIESMPPVKQKPDKQICWSEVARENQNLIDFSANLKSSPLMDGYDRPDL